MKQIKLLFGLVFILTLMGCESESTTQLEDNTQARMSPYNLDEKSKIVWNEDAQLFQYNHEINEGDEVVLYEWKGDLIKNYLTSNNSENQFLSREISSGRHLLFVTTHYGPNGTSWTTCQQSDYNPLNDTFGPPYDIECPASIIVVQ
ncbi:hypothetical protein [uncultured Psychroserpens sp.]|uniref:hypothetical protein n=1 Tax=uncultured Psychroserpens sp. TaxID=255436 RepID=UPI00261DBBBD|nr:hypothetical protein [uncultured Psychroserpens sp.]